MKISTDREERKLQKQILKDLFLDYDAKHHDAYVIRYNKLFDDKMLRDTPQGKPCGFCLVY